MLISLLRHPCAFSEQELFSQLLVLVFSQLASSQQLLPLGSRQLIYPSLVLVVNFLELFQQRF